LKQVASILILFVCNLSSIAQVNSPLVSLIGDDEVGYEQTISECPSLLLEVAGNSMDSAYKLWTDMLVDIEASASDAGVDLKGTKIWINLFWESDGSIKKIVYYPKPNSKNMDFAQVTNVLEQFSANYNLPIDHTGCFSHYGSASFPVHAKLVTTNEK
jgi:hypothetical protein